MALEADTEAGELLQRLGERVRARRGALALTLRELAEQAGVSQRLLVSLEAGRANISVLRLAAVARALGSQPAHLLGDEPLAAPSTAPHRLVALLGLRGAGKSSIGARAAARLGLPFVELDELVASRAGMTLEALFALHGNDYYRKLEGSELDRLLAEPRSGIVATGGSIVTHHANFGKLRANALTVFLRASAEDHYDRVAAQGDVRALAGDAGMDELRAMLRARRALYEQAHHIVDTSALGLGRSVDAVVRIVREAEEPG